MSEWITKLPLKIFTTIKTQFSQTIKDSFGMTDDNFSTVGSSDTPAVFPFVRFQILPGSEQGQTFETSNFEAGLFSFQIDVFDNKTQSRARKVMTEIVRIMKTMGFRVNQMPSFEDTKDVHRMTARFQKVYSKDEAF